MTDNRSWKQIMKKYERKSPLMFRGEKIPTNYALYKKAIEIADDEAALHELIHAYAEENPANYERAANNLLFQVGYIGSNAEANRVRAALQKAGYLK